MILSPINKHESILVSMWGTDTFKPIENEILMTILLYLLQKSGVCNMQRTIGLYHAVIDLKLQSASKVEPEVHKKPVTLS